MNGTELLIIGCLKRNRKRDYWSVYFLAKKLNKNPSTISRALKSLEEKGIIERTKVRDRYYLTRLSPEYEKKIIIRKKKEVPEIMTLFNMVTGGN